MTWIIKEILEGDLGWSKIGSWGWIKERFYCGFPGEISIRYLAAGWIGQMLDMFFIKTFLRPWEFIRYSVLMVAQRVQKIFPSGKHGWQGQMEAGWFGEIQTDFWMLLDQCLRGEVDYLGHWQTTPAPIINGCCTTALVLSSHKCQAFCKLIHNITFLIVGKRTPPQIKNVSFGHCPNYLSPLNSGSLINFYLMVSSYLSSAKMSGDICAEVNISTSSMIIITGWFFILQFGVFCAEILLPGDIESLDSCAGPFFRVCTETLV